MCGICGRINRHQLDHPGVNHLVDQMMKLLQHRGPDHGAMWTAPGVGLGYRRLSVIDLSSGNQPVFSEDGQKVLVFNGEIYNFLELKRQFESDLPFHTNSDTEVVLRLYEKFGEDCLNHLRGMFAFSIWDADKKELFFARDRVGKKPFFYSIQNGNFIFASELRALLVHDDFDFEVDPEAIYHYLSLQYIPSPGTVFKNVFKLPPAHFGKVKEGQVQIQRYWHLDYTPQEWSEPEALERFEDLLKQSVSLRLISDVPLGAFLSGGMDSTTVVSMMASASAQRIKTFNISFEEQEFDEAPFASDVSKIFGTEHHELKVVPDHAGIIPKLVWHYSEPYADSSAIPTYYLSCMSREFVTVALSGDGGDELFGGYHRYLFSKPAGFLSPDSLPIRAVQKIPINMRIFWRLRNWTEERFSTLPSIYFQKVCFFNETQKREIFTPAFADRTRNYNTLNWVAEQMNAFSNISFPQNLMAYDINTYLPDDLLVKADVASMACSLEVRSPLLDQQMMEFAAALPPSLKIRKGITKYLLRLYLKNKVPDRLIDRPKMGFGVPIKTWFRQELRALTEDILLSDKATHRGYFRKGAVEKLIRRHCSGLFDHSYQLYALLVLEFWNRMFIDQRRETLQEGRFIA